MSKIICEFCGTSYPEASTQCPICGCVRSGEDNEILDLMNKTTQPEEYHHVKGGRFAEKNVRKRNAANSSNSAAVEDEENKKSEPSNKGLVITIIVLLVAIAAVIAYIVLMFFAPDFLAKKQDDILPTDQAAEATVDLSCKQIRLSATEYVIEEIGAELQLEPSFIPLNTDDVCTYFTDNDAVATVNAAGLVTAIGSGEANITLTCGEAKLTCKITVLEPKDPFALMFTDVTLTKIGDSCALYDGNANVNEIVWATDDENIAYVLDGNVIAAGPGTTTIYAGYNGETVTCIVHCDFAEEDPTEEDPTEATQAQPIVDNGPYSLKNAFGFSNSDVTIRIGESFTLILIDKNGDKVDGVSWSVVDGNSCSVKDGVVTGDSSGNSTVVATFNGKDYTCLVRVS